MTDSILWVVHIPTYEEVTVESDNWHHAVKEAAVKLGLTPKFRLEDIYSTAKATRQNPKPPGRKKEFPL